MATLGPNHAGTFANDSTVGTVDWSNLSNAGASDDSWADAVLPSQNDISHYLKLTNFGFSVPAHATIVGISAAIERYETGFESVQDSSVKLVVGGTVVGDEKASGTKWPLSDATESYGGGADLWGLTPTPAEVSASDFGIVVAATNLALGENTAFVDDVTITVTISYPTPTVTDCTPATGSTAGGTSVTLTGTNFYSGYTPKVGGVALTGVTVNSTTELVGTTGAHAAGTVDVTVENPDGGTGTLSNGYEYSGGGGATFSDLINGGLVNCGLVNGGLAS